MPVMPIASRIALHARDLGSGFQSRGPDDRLRRRHLPPPRLPTRRSGGSHLVSQFIAVGAGEVNVILRSRCHRNGVLATMGVINDLLGVPQ